MTDTLPKLTEVTLTKGKISRKFGIELNYPATAKKATSQAQQGAWKSRAEAGFCDLGLEALRQVFA